MQRRFVKGYSRAGLLTGYGKDVERFKYNLEHPTPVSAEEVTKARETYEKFRKP